MAYNNGVNAIKASTTAEGIQAILLETIAAMKEANETEYWIEVLVGAGILDWETVKPIYNQCGTIRRILIASINTAKKQMNTAPMK